MSRVFSAIFAIVFCVSAAWAEAIVRIDPANSEVTRSGAQLDLRLTLSGGVPYRAFTLDEPARLVLDFRGLDWSGIDPVDINAQGAAPSLRFGPWQPGWSRLVVDLPGPFVIETAGLDLSTDDAILTVSLSETSPAAFAARSGAPAGATMQPRVPAKPGRPEGGPVRVVLDPGHGGIDPGAEKDGANEATLMLIMARELEAVLEATGGFDVTLTRDADVFVSLDRRVSVAHAVQADLFVSLHADALSAGQAHGATVYTLSEEASDIASARLAERHNRSDILAGVDLSDSDDAVARVLMDLARQETAPRARALADRLVAGMAGQVEEMNRRPLRQASFSVLKAADVPSVLIEVGFLTSDRDLANLRNPAWRARMAQGIRDGIVDWVARDRARAALRRP